MSAAFWTLIGLVLILLIGLTMIARWDGDDDRPY